MRSLEDRELERAAFLMTIYELTDGESMNETSIGAVAAKVGVDDENGWNLYRWASDRTLTSDHMTMGGTGLSLSARGIDAVEDMLRKGSQPPKSVLVLSAEEMRSVEVFLTEYRRAEEADDVPVSGEERLELDAEVQTIEAQMRSPKPKRRVVKASLNEVRHLLRGASGSGLFHAILTAANALA